mgnify:CR=1 FL=1
MGTATDIIDKIKLKKLAGDLDIHDPDIKITVSGISWKKIAIGIISSGICFPLKNFTVPFFCVFSISIDS